ncbi:MAG: hypothetical protein HKN27_07975 [Silicimonas sp.]|nr:hypothetical protein [Silicimonas sp.]
MQNTNVNKEVDALNEALVGGARTLAIYAGWAALAAALLFLFLYIFGRFIDTGAPRYLIPAIIWGAVAYFGLTTIWSRIKP